MSYCNFILTTTEDSVHRIYHDTEYGFPIYDDNLLFARLVLEINQAGLSWTTILNKKENFFKAYHQFNIKKVAAYKDTDRERLLNDTGIIRNRLKVDAAIHNANQILQIQKQEGSFYNWLVKYHPSTKEEWVKIFKKQFKFTGGEIVNEFLMSTGFLQGAHHENCTVFKKLKKEKPMWMQNKKSGTR